MHNAPAKEGIVLGAGKGLLAATTAIGGAVCIVCHSVNMSVLGSIGGLFKGCGGGKATTCLVPTTAGLRSGFGRMAKKIKDVAANPAPHQNKVGGPNTSAHSMIPAAKAARL